MKNIYKVTLLTAFFAVIGLNAQDIPTESNSEVTEKTYTLYKNGEKITNSVRITTEVRRAVATDPKDEGMVNGDRIYPPKIVVKTVEIDNDSDMNYDEKIKFSYMTQERTDFTLVSREKDLVLAVEDGKNITVLEDQKKFKRNEADKTSYVYTDDNGNKINFKVEEENRMNTSK